MSRVFYFDVASILALAPIFIAIFIKKLYKGSSSKIFLVLMLFTYICAFFEIFCCFPNKMGETWMWIFESGYFLFRTLMPATFLVYLLFLMDRIEALKKNKLLLTAFMIPTLVTIILLLINYPNGIVFKIVNIDGDITYQRSWGIWILYGIAALYMLLSLCYILKYRKYFNYHQFISLLSLIPLTLSGVISQMFSPNYLVELFTTSLGLILISTSIESPNEIIDQKTGLLSYRSFINVIDRSYFSGTRHAIVLVQLNNYSEVFNLLSFDQATRYIKMMSDVLSRKYKSLSKNYKTYYLDEGLFGAVAYNIEDAKNIADAVNIDFVNQSATGDYKPDFTIVVIDLLTDFKDLSSFFAFINNFRTKDLFNEEMVLYSKIKNEKSFIIQNNIDTVIEDGLKNNEFEVYYQPIYDVKSGKFKSAEALVRLNSSKYGFIVPNLFINHAEKNGKIIQIDSFVINEVFKFVSSTEFNDLGLEFIEINLSMIDCKDKGLFDRIKGMISKYNLDINRINFEVTESIDSDHETIGANIRKINSIGIKFSLDDYGTGYSNIERFTTLPLDIIKIDKTLSDKYQDPDMENVIKNTFRMIKDLNRKIVVEGIEEENQANHFIECGCDYIQGYYYSKPLPKDKFIDFIKENNK